MLTSVLGVAVGRKGFQTVYKLQKTQGDQD